MKISGEGSPMKKNIDGVGETPDPGLSLFWLDESFSDAMPMPVTKTPRRPSVFEKMYADSAVRSLMKTLTWRILATVTTVVVIYALTDDGDLAMTVGYLDVTLKMGLYYFHERIWNRVRVGTKKIRT